MSRRASSSSSGSVGCDERRGVGELDLILEPAGVVTAFEKVGMIEHNEMRRDGCRHPGDQKFLEGATAASDGWSRSLPHTTSLAIRLS